MTLKVIKPYDLCELGVKFDEVDQSIGMETLRGYEAFADGLEARWKDRPDKP
jgi:hypothetical protein